MNPRLDRTLTALLHYGSWFACALIVLGLTLALRGRGDGMRIVVWGIGLFIVLPPIRVVVMLIEFLRERDYRLALSATIVLTIIGVGLLLASRHAATSSDRGATRDAPESTTPVPPPAQ
ncbi:MAG: DUF1634 domain-containing protein [Acidobacteriota bacterium]|nr:DUF1634 domain-containing protein [Acidobacteriota bacterium]